MRAFRLAGDSATFGWLLLIVGLCATASAWRYRHPDSSADFTLFYISAQHTSPEMFEQPPGPPRGNMNPPLFQLMMRPLTLLSLPAAASVFRALNVLALCGCIWWLVRTSNERWTLADYGALLAWAPMASVVVLNQLTWIMWPLLVWAWWCWRQERWSAGAIGYGLAVSLKPFLGVFALWLLVTGRWKAAVVSGIAAGAAFAIGLAVYGVAVNLAWLDALGNVTWSYAGMNAALHGLFTRAMSKPIPSSDPLVLAPDLVDPLATTFGAAIVLVTLLRTRTRNIDESWLPLMASALLASPLGWLYYMWWLLPGTRPTHLLRESPLLWMPMAFPMALEPSNWLGLTLGSVYFWGLFSLWLHRMCFEPARDPQPQVVARRSLFLRSAFAVMIFGVVAVARTQFVLAKQTVENDPVIGTWSLDLSQSTFTPETGLESRTITFVPVDNAIRVVMLTDYSGAEKVERVQYTARYNQKDHLIQHPFLGTISLTRIDVHRVETSGKGEDGSVEQEIRTISPDGATLTVATRGTQAGAAYSSVQVFKRLG